MFLLGLWGLVVVVVGGGVGECWEVVRYWGAGRGVWVLREIRPLLYNVSCISKAPTAMLPVVVTRSRTGCVFVRVCVVLKAVV